MDLTFWVELLLFVVLMGLSGFFSSAETALFSPDGLQLGQMRRHGNPRIGLIERTLSQPRRLIVVILIGNEFVIVAASVISAAMVIQFLGAESKWMNLLVLVPALLLIGEITPKTLVIRSNVAFGSFECRPIALFARLISPLRWLVRIVANRFITLIVGSQRSHGNIVTVDRGRTLARKAVGEATLDPHEARFIDQIFDFGNKTSSDVMTPRADIFLLPVEATLAETLAEQRRTRQTKIPLYREHGDTIVGVRHARDMLGIDIEAPPPEAASLAKLVRPAYFIPATEPASNLIETFRQRKLSIALTVDAYGGVTGPVTMEGLLECVFGEMRSPSDARPHDHIRLLPDGHYEVDGAMAVEGFKRERGAALSDELADTGGGLPMHEHGELPGVDTAFTIGDIHFVFAQVEDNRIGRILVEKRAVTETLGEAPTPEASDKAGAARPASTSLIRGHCDRTRDHVGLPDRQGIFLGLGDRRRQRRKREAAPRGREGLTGRAAGSEDAREAGAAAVDDPDRHQYRGRHQYDNGNGFDDSPLRRAAQLAGDPPLSTAHLGIRGNRPKKRLSAAGQHRHTRSRLRAPFCVVRPLPHSCRLLARHTPTDSVGGAPRPESVHAA